VSVIEIDSFIDFCKTLVSKELHTIWREKPFVLTSVNNERLDWLVKSTGNYRYSKRHWIEKYLNQYAKTGASRPKDYPKTTEASYILTLIELYVKHRSSKVCT